MTALDQPLVAENSRGARVDGRVISVVSLLVGVGFGVIIAGGGPQMAVQEPTTDMAFQIMPSTGARKAPLSVVPSRAGQFMQQAPPQFTQPASARQIVQQPTTWQSTASTFASSIATAAAAADDSWDAAKVGDLNSAAKVARLKHLEEQAAAALKAAVDSGKKVVFPNALIAGDAVISHILFKYDLLSKVEVLAVDTLHLFPETMEFLKAIEDAYNFKAYKTMAVGVEGEGAEAKAMYDKIYGADLWKTNIEEYDRVCKVEPFQRGLKDLGAEVIVTGRTRWQGNERAWLDLYEAPRKAGGVGNCNPIAFWTLEDTFDYIAMNKILHHPLHAKGYPSIGDAKDTIPIPEDGSVVFKDFQFTGDKTEWLGYALERKGRFVGLKNKDGSTKTECGIHVDGAEKTWDRDLWDKSTTVKNVESEEEIMQLKAGATGTLAVVYAPWCQFCQAMEDNFEELSKSEGFEGYTFAKFRGDTRRDFVQSNLETQSFPTIVMMKNNAMMKYPSEDRDPSSLRKFIKQIDEGWVLNQDGKA
eukprot:gnl/TRDRNA2_/TRDRNA2_154174_c0_seq7.p1 gnl/TRDRNA2_/TRDRNA2_154174_c0~~gnl/TRDRNA2_/TRDRNA2_154174_c0_seq7.p1  ORF type:complete len:530 (+),score=125.44 gnl/TRDRNA2_/TRDRNA2_154174_c0_seq7:81-1670(+)